MGCRRCCGRGRGSPGSPGSALSWARTLSKAPSTQVVAHGGVDDLVRVVGEEPREAAEREAPGEARSRAHLAVAQLAVRGRVVDPAGVQLGARADGAVEDVGLQERDLVVAGARTGLGGQAQRLAQAQEVGGLEAAVEERPLQPRDAPAQRELVAVLLLELEGDVDLLVVPAAGAQLRRPFQRLEVAELVQPADGQLQGLGVEDAALVQVDLAANDLVPRAVVADEADAPHGVPPLLLHGQGDVHHAALGVGHAPRVPVHWK